MTSRPGTTDYPSGTDEIPIAAGQPVHPLPPEAPRVSPPGAQRDWGSLRDQLADHHAAHPQRATLAQLALDSIHHGIAELAKLGHRFMLVEGAMAQRVQEWPKMLYHDKHGQRVVGDSTEARNLGPGWRDTQQADPEQVPPVDLTPPDDEAPKLGTGYNPRGRAGMAQAEANAPSFTQKAEVAASPAPTPAVTDKQATEDRIAKGAGASSPTTKTDEVKDKDKK